ncbi:trypsin-like serine protease [Micromonospora echinofusca]|uniref:Trypsin-like serine protease n=1 Tax=Micromonospora echinofusca TaxID=47858 RepID=A0ABS3VVP0_MICEH|nr:trypsin-like serine protease [Micromonospora echinofusca]MBO4208513.1 trypsin-like serine protease [Micromonospora echinofusca]
MRRRRRMALAGLVTGTVLVTATAVALTTGDAPTGTPDSRFVAGQQAGQPGSSVPAGTDGWGRAPAGGESAAPRRTAAAVAAAAPASVAYLRTRYGVTAAEAARRLALQEASAPLADRLAGQFPGSYAGLWLDQAAGGVLTVAASDPAPVRRAVAGLPDATHIRVVPVRHPLRALTSAAGRVAAALDVESGRDVLVDQQANGVVVLTGDRVPADDPRLADALAGAGVPARSAPAPTTTAVPKACDPRYCAKAPMRGGIRLDIPRDDGTVGGCTSGFTVFSRSTGRYYLLTAGHCVVGGRHQHVDSTWHQYLGPKVPVTVEATQAGLGENAYPYDYALMTYPGGAVSRWVYPAGTADQPALVNYWCGPGVGCATSRDVRVTGVVAYSAVQVGWVACATGSAYTPAAGERYVDSGAGAGYVPGTRCGEITGKTSGGIDVRICARPGDSGGPLFLEADGRALGILSNGDPGQGACTNPEERNHYAPVSTVLARANSRTGGSLDLRLATTGPALPGLTGDRTDPQPTYRNR